MRDDIEFNIQFCEIVEQYPALYDYNKPEYSNKNIQDKIWREIGLKLGATAKDCKERWKNIRCSYSKNKKNMNAPSGSAARTPKEYYLAPNLRFLDIFLKSRPSKGNLGNDADQIEDENDLTCMSAGSSAGELQATDLITPQQTPPPPQNKQIHLSTVNKTAHEYFTLKNKQLIARQQNIDEGTKVNNKDDSDADMAFFRSMLPDVQTMNRDQKRKLKFGVLNLIEEILKEPITSRISYSKRITPYQRTPSRESEYNSPANVGSYGSPTGSYGNESPQQLHTTDVYRGLTLQQTQPTLQQTQPAHQQTQPTLQQTQPAHQQTQPTGGYGGLTLQQTQPTLQQTQPAHQQTQPTLQQTQPAHQQTHTTGGYGDPTLPQMQTSGAYRDRAPQRAGARIYVPLYSPVTPVSPPSHQTNETDSQAHDGDVYDFNY